MSPVEMLDIVAATGRPTMVTAQDILSGAPIVPVYRRTEVHR